MGYILFHLGPNFPMETVATVCNNIIECDGEEDEKNCSGTNLPTIIVSIFAVYFVLIYVFLKIKRFQKFRNSTPKEYQQGQMVEMKSKNEIFIEFERNHLNEEIVENITLDLLKITMNVKEKENEKMLRKFFNIVAKLHDFNESRTILYLHQNFNSILNDKILRA